MNDFEEQTMERVERGGSPSSRVRGGSFDDERFPLFQK